MKHLMALVSVCTLGVACTDEPERDAPTAPAIQAPEASIARAQISTICLSYAGEEARLEAALSKAPEDARVKAQLAAMEAAIKDACG